MLTCGPYSSAKEAIIKSRSDIQLDSNELKNRIKMLKILQASRNPSKEEKNALDKLEMLITDHN